MSDWSKEEIQAYYSEEKKTFVPLEVSQEEKDRITAHHLIYISDEYRYQTYLAVKQLCEGLNFFNDWEGRNNITPAKMQVELPFLWPFVKSRLEDTRFWETVFLGG